MAGGPLPPAGGTAAGGGGEGAFARCCTQVRRIGRGRSAGFERHRLAAMYGSAISAVKPRDEAIDVPDFASDRVERGSLCDADRLTVIHGLQQLCARDLPGMIETEEAVRRHEHAPHVEPRFSKGLGRLASSCSADRSPSSLASAIAKGSPPRSALYVLRNAITASFDLK